MLENYEVAPDEEKESLSNFLGNYFKLQPATFCESLGEGSCDGMYFKKITSRELWTDSWL